MEISTSGFKIIFFAVRLDVCLIFCSVDLTWYNILGILKALWVTISKTYSLKYEVKIDASYKCRNKSKV